MGKKRKRNTSRNKKIDSKCQHQINKLPPSSKSVRSNLKSDLNDEALDESVILLQDITSKVVHGATYVSQNVTGGAEKLAMVFNDLTKEMINRIDPDPQSLEINPDIQKTIEVIKKASGGLVDVTDYLVTTTAKAASVLGEYLSSPLQELGTQLLTATTTMAEREANDKINSVLNATSSAVDGLSTVYSGFSTAASILTQNLKDNSVQLVKYKYGHAVGVLVDDALTTFINIIHTNKNIKLLKPNGIVKATMRDTGKALLGEYKNSSTSTGPHKEFQGTGPGNGCGFNKY